MMSISSFILPAYGVLVSIVCALIIGLAVDALTREFDRVIVPGRTSIFRSCWDVLMIPGVLMHELSHAVVLFLTGARIDEIVIAESLRHPLVLFRRRGVVSNYDHAVRAGHVSYACRGPFFVVSFQKVLGAVAPTVVGVVCMGLLVHLIIFTCVAWWHYILCVYLFICALHGSNMSRADVRNMLPGIPVVCVTMYVVMLITGFNIFALFPSDWGQWCMLHAPFLTL